MLLQSLLCCYVACICSSQLLCRTIIFVLAPFFGHRIRQNLFCPYWHFRLHACSTVLQCCFILVPFWYFFIVQNPDPNLTQFRFTVPEKPPVSEPSRICEFVDLEAHYNKDSKSLGDILKKYNLIKQTEVPCEPASACITIGTTGCLKRNVETRLKRQNVHRNVQGFAVLCIALLCYVASIGKPEPVGTSCLSPWPVNTLCQEA